MSVGGPDIEHHMNQSSESVQISGRVSQLRENWRVFEDGALAERLQSEEIAAHLGGNKLRNHQIRNDFPKALEEQTKEKDQASRQNDEHRKRLRELENKDAEVAQKLQLKDLINSNTHSDQVKTTNDSSRVVLSASDMRHRDYEVERDRVFAQRLQRLEAEHSKKLHEKKKPTVPQPQGTGTRTQHIQPNVDDQNDRDTPPLPVLSNGDVLPTAFFDSAGSTEVHGLFSNPMSEDDVLPHVKGGIKYNDDQYIIKLARPAVVTSEPLYANNHPEHYAVSTKYPFANSEDERSRGAVRKSRNYESQHPDCIEYDTGACLINEGKGPEPVSGLLLDAAGLSQKDLALSKKAEEQLIQERRDAELARRMQEDLSLESNIHQQIILDEKAAKEADDFEYARALQEKEELKLRRAKERSKQRRKQREILHQNPTNSNEIESNDIIEGQQLYLDQDCNEIVHSTSASRISKKSQGGRDDLGANLNPPDIPSATGGPITKSDDVSLALRRRNLNMSYDDSDSVASVNHNTTSSASHPRNKSISPKEMKPPARKPYMNTGAIDLHQSEFAVDHGRSRSGSGAEEIIFDDEEDDSEPRYANVGPKGPLAAQLNYRGSKLLNNVISTTASNVPSKDNSDEPIPPYMPMQQQTMRYNPRKYEVKKPRHFKL